jgi:enoyl-CoA hydratase
MSKILLKEINNGILTVTIDREEKYNALNIQFFTEMDEALDEIYDNDAIKSVIITGKGLKAFAAGADISEFSSFDGNKAKKLSRDGHNVLNRIESCPKPILAAVNGFALGGGCELAMACHLRVASQNASFGQPEVN